MANSEWEEYNERDNSKPPISELRTISADLILPIVQHEALSNIGPDDRNLRTHKTSVDIPKDLWRVTNTYARHDELYPNGNFGKYCRAALKVWNSFNANVLAGIEENPLLIVAEIEKRDHLNDLIYYREQNFTEIERLQDIVRRPDNWSPEIVSSAEDSLYNLADKAMDTAVRAKAKEVVEMYLRNG